MRLRDVADPRRAGALIFLIDFLAGRLIPGGPPWRQAPALSAISFVIWFAFAVDYVVRLDLCGSVAVRQKHTNSIC